MHQRLTSVRTLLLATALSASVISGLPLLHAAQAAEKPAAAQIPDSQNVTRTTLENGLHVVIIRNTLTPVVTTEINYLVGSAEAPAGFPGTAHALEHMMFRGAKGLDKDQLAAIGARIGGDYNADTTEDVTQYFYTAPAEDLGILLKIEALRMNGLTLSDADWDKERGAISQEVSRDLSSPAYKYISQLQSILFRNTPYAHDALGTRDSFGKTDAALLRKFYETWYAPNNAILVISGDVDPGRTLDLIRSTLGKIPKKNLPARAAVKPASVPARTLSFPTDYPAGFATIAFPMPGMTSKDFATADILSDVLSSQRGALYQLVPAGKALYAGFEFSPKKQAGFGLAIAAFPKGGDAQAALANIRTVLADIRDHGVPADLVEAARRREVAQLGFSANSVSGLASSWSNALAFQNLGAPDDIIAAYQAVTPEDVNRLARTLLDPTHAVTAVLLPESSGKPIEGKGFGGAESFASAPEKPVTLPDWAQQALAKLDIPPAAPAPAVFTLPNGIRLIVRPANVSHTISLAGMIRHNTDLQEPAGKEGVEDITDGLFSYGTTQHDRLAFRKALDDVPAWISAGTSFSLKVPSGKFEAGMKLLAENELHPAFPDQAFQVVRTQAAQTRAGELQSPDYIFDRAVMKAINPAGDPSLREATPKTLMAVTPADVRAYYASVFRPDMTTIVITGDITPEQARTVTEREFGSWKAIGPKPDINLPQRPDSKASHAQVPDNTSVQDSVILAESLPLNAAAPDRYILQLGNTILGDGFSSRFYRDLRVKNGYVYSVSSELSWGRTRAAYSVSYGADPDKVRPARELVMKNLRTLQTTDVTQDELTVAKSSVLRSLPLQQASLDSIAGLYLHLTSLDLPLNQSDIAAKIYYKTTAADIRKAFSKWMRPDDLATIVKGPAAK
ncbi:insulinase family protein [Acetobacter sp. AN02]|uniref:M16 family metallopeptidase n=1 Tax=Acetobacter sp. AN02 TaxID=2894186 RepID=UPI0024340C91|nr:pitrilysin family protein [Acetobacter sp. AN02]MDG6095046.1 insulinase family protein [Acetobacter sp. AN02]